MLKYSSKISYITIFLYKKRSETGSEDIQLSVIYCTREYIIAPIRQNILDFGRLLQGSSQEESRFLPLLNNNSLNSLNTFKKRLEKIQEMLVSSENVGKRYAMPKKIKNKK